MQKLFAFCHKYFFLGTVLFLLAFIPLFPKLPFIDIVGTWVDIRREDFIIAVAIVLLGIQVLRKKVSIRSPLTIPIIIYWFVGLLSLVISLAFIAPTLSNFFPKVSLLFYLRQIEYMIVFFLSFVAIVQHKKHLPIVVAVLAITAFIVFLYGIGQKYDGAHFPAYSTMNEEFAKGIPLKLPPTARVMATFAGHYDLAAYLVLMIPIIGSVIFGTKKRVAKILLLGVAFCSLILLLLTASRVSFGVYLFAISSMLWWQKKRWLIIPVVIVSIVMVNFVGGASDRFLKTLRFNDVVVDLSTGKPIGTLDKIEGGKAVLERIGEPDEENLPKGTGFISVPVSSASGAGTLAQVEYFRKKELTVGKGDVATISGSYLIRKAFVLDISITTRFQGQWPRAVAAFKRNILTGSGFSSLSSAADGNYHRMLGETGLLGIISFMGIFLYAFAWFFKVKNRLEPLEKAFVIGVFAGILGLCLNALLIDVFAASKVAFVLWLLMGVTMAILGKYPLEASYAHVLYRFFTHRLTFLAYICLGILLLYSGGIGTYFIGDDFTWLRWAAQSNVGDIPSYFTDASGFFYRPIPKLWYFMMFAFFWLMPSAYHLVSIALFIGITLLLLGILHALGVRTILKAAIIVLFATLSIHHENVFWVSGQSSLLAGFFLLGSVYTFMRAWRKQGVTDMRFLTVGFVSLVLGMLSWDTMVVAPIIIALIGAIGYKRYRMALIVVLIPFYIAVRTLSHAVPAEGDYGVHIDKLLVNSVGNGVTYFLATFVGPKVIETGAEIRAAVKQFALPLSVLGSVVAFICVVIGIKMKRMWSRQRVVLVYVCSFIISLVPFLGLGGAADRYALIPSLFIMIVLGLVLEQVVHRYRSLLVQLFIVVLFTMGIFWNYAELSRITHEWQFAGKVTEQTLLMIRKRFYPPTEKKTFVFINTPTRYGRAWIFPTGLNDALWHMFRGTPYYVVPVTSVEEAFAYLNIMGTGKEVLEFEDYKLKEVVRETRP